MIKIKSQTEAELVICDRPGILSYIFLLPSLFGVFISAVVLWSVLSGMSVLSLKCDRKAKTTFDCTVSQKHILGFEKFPSVNLFDVTKPRYEKLNQQPARAILETKNKPYILFEYSRESDRGTVASEEAVKDMVRDIATSFQDNSQEIEQFWLLNFDPITLFLIVFFVPFLTIWSLAIYMCLHFSRFEFDRSQQIIRCRYYTILGIRNKTYFLEKVKSVNLIYHSGSKGGSGYYYLYLNHNQANSLHLGVRRKRSELEPIYKIVYTFIFPDREYQEPKKPSVKLSDIFKYLRGEKKNLKY